MEPGVTLTLDHVILDGGTQMFPSLQTASIMTYFISLEDIDGTADKGGSLILNEGVVIQNCGNVKSTTGAIYGWGCNTIVMNDGVKILNNIGNYTGGVSVSSGQHGDSQRRGVLRQPADWHQRQLDGRQWHPPSGSTAPALNPPA